MALNLKPLCPTCNQAMRKLKQSSPEQGYEVSLGKGYCANCAAWKDLTPPQRVKNAKKS